MVTTPVQETLHDEIVDSTKTRKSYTREYKLEVVKFYQTVK